MSFNKVILIGNVGKDPDIRSTNSGDRVASFSLATSERWKDKSTGQRKETTTWHNIVVWNQGLVGVIEEYVAKGSQIAIEGKITNRKYEKDGIDRYITEIVIGRFDGGLTLLGKREGGGGGGYERDEHGYGQTRDRTDGRGGFDAGQQYQAELDDEIPF